MNKYVEFVSDENFEIAVKRVLDAYKEFEKEKQDTQPLDVLLDKDRQTIDEFKTVFDLCSKGLTLKEWTSQEVERQLDKKINNKIGEFHQELLGYVDGWINLETGDQTGLDLKNEEETIFIELKNKYNTMNKTSKEGCQMALENVVEKNPNSKGYWAYVISRNYKSEESVWEYSRTINDEKIKFNNPQVRRISGDKLYEMITGDKDALEKVCRAIPIAIKNIKEKEEDCISPEDAATLDEFYKTVFKKSE